MEEYMLQKILILKQMLPWKWQNQNNLVIIFLYNYEVRDQINQRRIENLSSFFRKNKNDHIV